MRLSLPSATHPTHRTRPITPSLTKKQWTRTLVLAVRTRRSSAKKTRQRNKQKDTSRQSLTSRRVQSNQSQSHRPTHWGRYPALHGRQKNKPLLYLQNNGSTQRKIVQHRKGENERGRTRPGRAQLSENNREHAILASVKHVCTNRKSDTSITIYQLKQKPTSGTGVVCPKLSCF